MPDLSTIDINRPDVTVDSVPVCDGFTKEIRQATVVSFQQEHHLSGEHKFLYGATAARPAFGKVGRVFYNFETKEIELDTGGGWIPLGFFTNKIRTVGYIGDGNPSQSITGLNGSPIFVLIVPFGNGGAYVRFTPFAGLLSYKLDSATLVDNGIISLDPDGFTVGLGANFLAGSYHALCLFFL